jgi:hypothetical protein
MEVYMNTQIQIDLSRKLNEIRKVARKKGYTHIQAEILAQLTYLNPFWMHTYNIDAVLNIADGYGIRLHHKSKNKTINIDIIYQPDHDTYTIKAYRINSLKAEKVASCVLFPELDQIIGEILATT